MMENQDPEPQPSPSQLPFSFEQLTATEFAKFVVEFYKALLALGIKEEFAQKLTAEFVRRP